MFCLATLTLKCLAENDVKNDVIMSKRHPDVMYKSHLTTPGVRRHFLAPVSQTEILVGYARTLVLELWVCSIL